jgi:hypothetical protein
MANQWLRLWHDMPNDPKFKTVARVSKRPITEVLSIYLHLLVDASRNVTRGHVNVTIEDISSAIDVQEEHVSSILDAMEGRLICQKKLTGWDSRQPKNEDVGNPESGAKSALQRKKEQRERDKEKQKLVSIDQDVTKCHEMSRNVTIDKDKDKEYIKESNTLTSITKEKRSGSRLASDWYLPEDWLTEAKAIRSDLSTEQIRRESESFKDYWVGKAGKDAAKLDWQATWRNWIRRSSTQAAKPKKFDPFEYVNRSAINGHATIDITPKPMGSDNTELGYIEHKTTFQPF